MGRPPCFTPRSLVGAVPFLHGSLRPSRGERSRRGAAQASRMMYEPEYMEAFDVMALADDGRDCQPPAVACDACTDTTPRLTLDEAIAEFLRAGATEPVAEPLRTADDSAEVDSPRPIAVAHEGRPASPPGGTSADREPSVQPTSREGLLRRAISMFCNGRQNMVVHSSAADVSDVTFDLIASVKAVVTAVFKDHAESLCSSPERPDLRLSQEEAMGHLVGSLFVGEVLVEEARPLGKRLDFHAGKEAKAEAAGKESVRHQKKAVRRKKGLSSDEQQRACDDIDRIAAEAHVEHLAQTVDLSLPNRRSVIVERRAPKSITLCQGCTRTLRSADEELSPLQARFGRPCPCVWGTDQQHEDPQPTSKGAVARAWRTGGPASRRQGWPLPSQTSWRTCTRG